MSVTFVAIDGMGEDLFSSDTLQGLSDRMIEEMEDPEFLTVVIREDGRDRELTREEREGIFTEAMLSWLLKGIQDQIEELKEEEADLESRLKVVKEDHYGNQA